MDLYDKRADSFGLFFLRIIRWGSSYVFVPIFVRLILFVNRQMKSLVDIYFAIYEIVVARDCSSTLFAVLWFV